MTDTKAIWCAGCSKETSARLTNGAEIYPHREDLFALPFWKCDTCGNHVGCHYKSKRPTEPLGIIPTAKLRNARQHIHRLIDPVWQSGKLPRGKVYAMLSERIGKQYHTAEIRSIEDAREIYKAARELFA